MSAGDSDGFISELEFLASLAIMKRNLLEVEQLQHSFTAFREEAKRKAAASRQSTAFSTASAAAKQRPAANPKEGVLPLRHRLACGQIAPAALGTSDFPQQQQEEDEGSVYASDLVAALGVTMAEAEEMIFIADLEERQAIQFTEFKQVVVNWSR